MAIPDCQILMLPVLELALDGQEHTLCEEYDDWPTNVIYPKPGHKN